MQQQIQSLKDSELTQVLADGFAVLYHRRPKFPVTYLANYLKNYQYAQTQKKKISEKISNNKKIADDITKKEEQSKNKILLKENESKKIEQEQKQFLEKIAKTQYHEDILDEFCNWIEKKFNLTGVYIGQLKNKKKKINLAEEDGQQAHFDAQAPKLIYFEHASNSHRDIMLDKTLTQQSVLGKLLSGNAGGQAQNQQPPAQGGQEGGAKQSKPKDEIFFPTVVDNKQLNFFKFPRLGSFFGVASKINSYLSNKLFDDNAQKVESYTKQHDEYEKLKQQRETKFRQQYDEKANGGAQQQELQAMQKQFEKQQAQFPKPVLKQFSTIKRQFVFGFDTLGQDRQISKQDQTKIKEYINHLKTSWQNTELEQLKTDIDRHLKLIDKIEVPHQQTFTKMIGEQDKEVASHQEVQKFKQNQKLMELQMDTLRMDKLKQYLNDQKYQPFLEQILKAKVLKYQQILKYWLLFAGYKKEQINYEGTNVLDYRKIKALLNKDSFLKAMNEYHPRGSKPESLVPNYAKWERMERNFKDIDPATIAAYNIYLAFIMRYLKLVAKVRQADRAKRVNIMKQQRKARAQRKRQNMRAEKKKLQKIKRLEAARAEAEQKQETFDQQAWLAQNNEGEQAQPPQVGPEIIDEIDRDLEVGEQLFPQQQVVEEEEADNQVPPPAAQ